VGKVYEVTNKSSADLFVNYWSSFCFSQITAGLEGGLQGPKICCYIALLLIRFGVHYLAF
jgi:hypothetical protein